MLQSDRQPLTRREPPQAPGQQGSRMANPPEEIFGERLRRLRISAGLTQEALAARAGLSDQAIGTLEQGQRRRPYPNTVRALADALGPAANERDRFLDPPPKRASTPPVLAAPARP